jgi:signal peptidase I
MASQNTLRKVPGTAASKTPAKPGPMRKFLREWVMPVAIVMAVMAPIRSVIADWNDVPSGSMRPTILEGDRIYVNKLAFGLRIPFTCTWISHWDTPRRGDIVTFASPADGIRLVKRIVGVPGDRIELRRNELYVNGLLNGSTIVDSHATGQLPNGARIPMVIESENLMGVEHAIAITPGLASLSSFPEVTVPAGHYFVMGDNRDQSNDSRFIGMVPLDSIYGRCAGVAMSLNPDDSYKPRWDRWFSGLK